MVHVTCILLAVFIVSLCYADDSEIESNFYLEEACAKARGFCLLEHECPHEMTRAFRRKCPGQRNVGAVCCENFPAEKVNCHQTHNACMDSCPEGLNMGRKGCPQTQTCCVLV